MIVSKNKNEFGALVEPFESPFETGELKVVDTFYVKYIKRAFDIGISLIAVIISLPVNLFIAIVTYFDLGRPLFFSHQRPGLAEQPFTIVKFRNMSEKKDSNGNLLPPDQRVTQIGKLARKTSMDELLQFWLILQGKMSIIGPRPLLMSYLPKYNMQQHLRHAVRPGLECPSLVKRDHPRTWEEQFEDDVWYVEHISFLVDIKMIWHLLKMVFDKKDVERRSEAVRGAFEGSKKEIRE